MVNRQPIDQFLVACEATGPLVLEVEDAAGGAVGRWSLVQPFALIGRDPKADVRLDDEQVSKRHAYLQIVGGRVWCLDLGSRSGVAWDGVARPWGMMEAGRTIGLGPYRIRLAEGTRVDRDIDDAATNPLKKRRTGEEPDLGVVIEFRRISGGHRAWRPTAALTLMGRAANCHVRINDNTVSRHHAALLCTAQGIWIVDLLSRAGLHLNGQRLAGWARLESGDRLAIGSSHMIVHLDAAEAQVPGQSIVLLPRTYQPDSLAQARARLSAETGTADEAIMLGVDAIVERVADRFCAIQSQMLDHFQEAMLAMLQMVGTQHRDQMGQVRAELERIQRLTQELQELQASAKTQRALSSATLDPEHASTVARPAQTDPGAEERRSSVPTAPDAECSLPTEAPMASSDTVPSAEAHTILHERLSALQNERQSRWQRILQLVTNSILT